MLGGKSENPRGRLKPSIISYREVRFSKIKSSTLDSRGMGNTRHSVLLHHDFFLHHHNGKDGLSRKISRYFIKQTERNF